MLSPPIHLCLITQIMFGGEYKLWSSSLRNFLQSPCSPFRRTFCYVTQDPSYCALAYIILFNITSTVILQCWRCHCHGHTFNVASTVLNLFVMKFVSRAKEMLCNNALYPDLYGHYREAKFTQTKHHWWWKANRVFNQLEVTRNHTGMSVQPSGGYTQPHRYVQPPGGYTQPHRYVCSSSWRLHSTTQVCLFNQL
jgi:hypothetical protein